MEDGFVEGDGFVVEFDVAVPSGLVILDLDVRRILVLVFVTSETVG